MRSPASRLSRARRHAAARTGADAAEYEIGDAAQRVEYAATVKRVGGELGDAAEVDRVRQVFLQQNQVLRQVLLVVLDHERHATSVDALLRQVVVEILEA